VHASAGRPLTITVDRGGKSVDLRVTPRLTDSGVGQIGVRLQGMGEPVYRRVGVLAAVAYGADTTLRWTRETVLGVGRMLYDREARESVGGPVAIARVAGRAFRDGAVTFFTFLAAISVNLGVLNLLPLLVVDGGHIALLLLEWVRGRKLQPSLQVSIQVVGMVLILLGMAMLTVRDINNWVGGKPF
jgi:regulator of sigma E protease